MYKFNLLQYILLFCNALCKYKVSTDWLIWLKRDDKISCTSVKKLPGNRLVITRI